MPEKKLTSISINSKVDRYMRMHLAETDQTKVGDISNFLEKAIVMLLQQEASEYIVEKLKESLLFPEEDK